MPPLSEPTVYRFPGWELRPAERLLIVQGQSARLGGRACDVLLALARRAGHVVRKDELLAFAWRGVVVEDNNLTVQITALRKLLGPQTIATVQGVGYRLVVEAEPEPRPGPFAVPPAPPVARAPMQPELFGRDADLEALDALVGRVGLVTIAGTGGVGKTTLARAVLARGSVRWADGVHWIDLTQCRPGESLLPRVARALGVLWDEAGMDSDDVVRGLAQRHALVVLDNCEHLMDAVCHCLAPLLSAAPGLRWLATSQEPLRLAGESVYRVAPLDVALPGTDLVKAMACGSLALFARRARAAGHPFELDGDTLGLALAICRALDGLPLALEMAAARLPVLGLRGLHDQLVHRLSLRSRQRDAPERQQTLRDAYAWSWGLLTPREQQLFRCLQPFRGGFVADMVAGLLHGGEPAATGTRQAPEPWAIETLWALIDKSLVHRMPVGDTDGAPRFMLLESARDYALLQLEVAGETALAQERHAESIAAATDAAWSDLNSCRDAQWLATYVPERDNVRAALAWACAHGEPALLARLVTVSALIEKVAHAESQVVHADVPLDRLRQAPVALRARACLELGWAHYNDGRRELSAELIEQALADSESLGDPAITYLSLVRLVRLWVVKPDGLERARALWERVQAIGTEGVPLRVWLYGECTVARMFDRGFTPARLRQLCRIARQAGFDMQAAIGETNLTDELLRRDAYDEAVQAAEEALRQPQDETLGLAFVRFNMAHALVRLDRVDAARQCASAMLRATPGQAHMVLDLFAYCAARQGRWEDAALMAGSSARIKRERGWRPDPPEERLIGDTMHLLRDASTPEDRVRLMALGGAMAVADVLALAQLG